VSLALERSCICLGGNAIPPRLVAVAGSGRDDLSQSPSVLEGTQLSSTTTHFGIAEPNCADNERATAQA
jgi:hypothetical protein